MKNSNKPWSMQDLKYLENNFYDPIKILAKVLGRSYQSIADQKTLIRPKIISNRKIIKPRKVREIFQWEF